MKTLLLGILTLLGALGASAATLSGTVTSDSGSPLAGMTAAAYTAVGALAASGATTASGTYSLTVPAGTYRVLAYDPSGTFATSFSGDAESFETSAPIAVSAAQNVTNLNFRLVRSGFVVGSVTDTGGMPLPDVTVAAYNLSGTRRGFTKSGATGSFTLALPPGTFKVVAHDDALSYAPAFFDNANSFAAATPLTVAATESTVANLELLPAAKLAGTVTDRVSGAPLPNITAVAYNADGTMRAFAVTDAAGAYSIVVPPGDYHAGVFDSALVYLPQFYPGQTTFAAATPQHAVARQPLGGIDFALTRGARVTAHVSARVSGTALPGITVGAYELSGRLLASATTDASGTATLLLPAGTVKLLASDSGLQYANAYYLDAATFAATQPVALSEGQLLTPSFSMTEGGRIAGTVTSAISGEPLPAMQVLVYDSTLQEIAQTTSDANGTFRLAVPAGTYIVAAADPSHHYATVFYAGATSATGASSVGVTAGHDTFPLALRLSTAELTPRRRTVRH